MVHLSPEAGRHDETRPWCILFKDTRNVKQGYFTESVKEKPD